MFFSDCNAVLCGCIAFFADGFFIHSESSEYSDWTEEVGLRTQQQTENRRPR